MQLNKEKSLRQALALATCTVLTGTAQAKTAGIGDWELEASLLSYQEKNRVSVVAPALFATYTVADEETVTVRTIYDVLTGSSPNGAIAANTTQTFTGPSGSSTYEIAPNEFPLVGFRDKRVAFGVDWSKRTSERVIRAVTGNISKEEDYLSVGGNISWSIDFNRKLTTLALGAGLSLDSVSPFGGAPDPYSDVPPAGKPAMLSKAQTMTRGSGGIGSIGGGLLGDEEGSERKQIVDVMIGVTQVLNRRTIAQFNVSHSQSSGYLNDPYKIVTVVDNTGMPAGYKYENRPDARSANILYGKLVRHLDEDVIHTSLRHFTDDWGVSAQTMDLQYRFMMGEGTYLEPQVRYHTQTAADFFRTAITLAESQTERNVSADLRLGEMSSMTYGVKFGTQLGDGELTLRLAQITQTGNPRASDVIGQMAQQDLYPTMEVNVLNLSYGMLW